MFRAEYAIRMKIGIVLMQIRIRIKMEIRIRMPKHNIAKEASLKTTKATGEAFNPQKKPSSTSKHENSLLFYIFVGHFCPPGSGYSYSN
jgi:hypothetical protein